MELDVGLENMEFMSVIGYNVQQRNTSKRPRVVRETNPYVLDKSALYT